MSLSDLPDIESICEETPASVQVINPDKRLLNWESLITARRKLYKTFEKNFKRKRAKLLINASEDRKELEEKRTIIDYARIPVWDKYRGNPTGWQTPPMLAKQCPEDDLEYRLTRTWREQGWIPDVEFVKVPDAVKKEKGAIFNRKLYDIDKSEYFKKTFGQTRILEMYPHIPDLHEIVAIGKNFKYEFPETKEDSEEILATSECDDGKSEGAEPTPKRNDYLLSLNDLRLYANETETRVLKTFVESSPGKIEFSYLSIHNNSDLVMRFVFKKHAKRMLLGKRADENVGGLFVYNKNTHVLQPGEKMDYSVGFKGELCGNYTEVLGMIIKPNPWEEGVQVLIHIQVNVIKNDFSAFCDEVESFLENQIRASVISETLELCLSKIPPKKTNIITYSYDKRAIFEAVNGCYINNEFFVKYSYDKKVVDELEDFYEKVRLEERHPENWDYRLQTLKEVTRQRESYENASKLNKGLDELFEKIEECELQREKLEQEVLKFWDDKNKKDDKGKGKPAGPKPDKKGKDAKDAGSKKKPATYVEAPRAPLPKTLSDDLNSVIGKLRASAICKDELFHKNQVCFSLVCAYFDKIGAECAALDLIFGIERSSQELQEKIYVEDQRIYDEKLFDCRMEYPKLSDLNMSFKDKPAPAWCLTIPLETYEARFAAFKTEKFVVSKAVPAKKPSKELVDENQIDEQEVVSKEEEEEEEEEKKDANLQIHYRNNLFMIINTNLWKLIDDISATFDLIPKSQSVRLENLEIIGLEAQKDLTCNEDENRVFCLKKAISDVLKLQSLEGSEEQICTCECVCESSPSILDFFKTYQTKTHEAATKTCQELAVDYLTKSCKDPAEVTFRRLSSFKRKEFLDAAVMTSPSIDLPIVLSEDDGEEGGVCGIDRSGDFDSIECICKKKNGTSFTYFDSVVGFDVERSLSSEFEDRSCDKDL